jgi:hypothetical protein
MDSLLAGIGGQLGAQRPLIGGPFGPSGVRLDHWGSICMVLDPQFEHCT